MPICTRIYGHTRIYAHMLYSKRVKDSLQTCVTYFRSTHAAAGGSA